MTETSKKEKCKEILNNYRDFEFVTQKEDMDFLLKTFPSAYYYEKKVKGQNIIKIQRKRTKKYHTPCFYIYREDGSSTDFSYTKMFNEKNAKRNDVIGALRNAIDQPVISPFRKTFTPFYYDGVLYKDVAEVEVDHYDMPFKDLANNFIKENGGVDSLYSFVNEPEDNSTETYFTNREIIDKFIDYHNAHTHLRFLPRKVNRSKQYAK